MSDKKLKSFEVSWLFVQEYYTIMNGSPEKLYQFYNKDSYYCNGCEGESSKIYHGQTEIEKKIKELEYEDCKVLVSNVDSQVSSEDGIIIQVLGEMSNKGGSSHKFAQTFFLAKQPNGYFVLNDIIRFLKEDIENEYEDFDTQNETSIQEPYVENQSTEVVTEEVVETAEPETPLEKKSVSDMESNVSPTREMVVEENLTESNVEMNKEMTTTEVAVPPSMEPAQTAAPTTTTPSATTTTTTTTTTVNQSSNLTTSSSSSSSSLNTTTNATSELTENSTESSNDNTSLKSSSLNVKRTTTNQIKSFATVTASNTNIHANNVPTHIKEISRVETKSSQKPSSQNRNVRQDQKSNNNVHPYEREVFLKDIVDSIPKAKIIEAFSAFGEVKKLEITRRTGVLEFLTVEAAKYAISKKHIVVDGHTIIAEEKHRRKPYNNSYNRNRSDYRDSRGGYQNGKSGNFMNRGKSIRSNK